MYMLIVDVQLTSIAMMGTARKVGKAKLAFTNTWVCLQILSWRHFFSLLSILKSSLIVRFKIWVDYLFSKIEFFSTCIALPSKLELIIDHCNSTVHA